MANSCRCSLGGETIRLSSQSSRVRYLAPVSFFLFFLSFFIPLYVFPFIFFPWEVVSSVCMFLFFCATHHPPVITTAVLRVVPTLRAHSAHTHRPGAHGLLEVPGIIHSCVLFSYWCKNSFDLTAESFACTVFTYHENFGTSSNR